MNLILRYKARLKALSGYLSLELEQLILRINAVFAKGHTSDGTHRATTVYDTLTLENTATQTGNGLRVVAYSRQNDARHDVIRADVGTDPTLGPLYLVMGAVPSASASSRRWMIFSGDFGNYRPITINEYGGNVGIGTGNPTNRLDIADGALGFLEMTAPDAGGAGTARLFARNSGGKTELCVRFHTGAIQVVATEPP